MARFSDQMVTEVVQRFWAAMARGELIGDAAAEDGTYRKKGARWLTDAGGVRPRPGVPHARVAAAAISKAAV